LCLSACYWAHIDNIYYSNSRIDARNIGFDDDFIYKEFKKELKERSINIEFIDCDEKNSSFDL
jgi:hypothetical protein